MAPKTTLKEWLQDRPFTLTMSSSFFGFYAHLGLITALVESGCAPAKVTGSSAGALVAAVYASGMSLDRAKTLMLALTRHDILSSWFDSGPKLGIFAAKHDSPLVSSLPTDRLEDCPIPIAISVYSLNERKTRVFTRGSIKEVVVASCTVPFLLEPAEIQGEAAVFLDGGVADLAGMEGCSIHERVLYHHATVAPLSMTQSHRFHPDSITTVVCNQLPVVTPFTLSRGEEAFEMAYQSMRQMLQQSRESNEILSPTPEVTLQRSRL